MGPPEAYHVGSEKSGTVKKTVKRSALVIMPLCHINDFSSTSKQDKLLTTKQPER